MALNSPLHHDLVLIQSEEKVHADFLKITNFKHFSSLRNDQSHPISTCNIWKAYGKKQKNYNNSAIGPLQFSDKETGSKVICLRNSQNSDSDPSDSKALASAHQDFWLHLQTGITCGASKQKA